MYEFDDEELRAIDRAGRDTVEVAFAFHGVRMYRDAARFLTFKRTGAFPNATGAVGLAALGQVLREDARFPSTRKGLLHNQGWKVFDLDDATRVHASEVLRQLPSRAYGSVDEVLAIARSVDARFRGGEHRPG